MKSSFLFPSLFSLFVATGVIPVAGAADDAAETVKLPPPVLNGARSLERTLHDRRSVRRYQHVPISLAELSQLLWAAQGITASGGRRTAPSAGALYPLEIHVVAGNVTGLPAAVYRYQPRDHVLQRTAEGDAREELCRAALGQTSIGNAPAVIAVSAVYDRTTAKYSERGIRYAHVEAGHAGQNISLQAAALDLGTVVVGAFHDDQVRSVLRLRKGEEPLLLMPVGKL